VSTLDPRAPLVLDTRQLGRRPGSLREVHRTVPAPADLGLDVIGVPEGADLELDLRLEAVVEGVLVTGTARGPLRGECVRCLEAVEDVILVDVQELFVHPGERVAGSVADDESRLDDDLLDLEPVLRDTVVLALPLSPVCRMDCPGLCSECGARLADDPLHAHDTTDPRWAELARLTRQTTEET
jgi:uncharacterized protein